MEVIRAVIVKQTKRKPRRQMSSGNIKSKRSNSVILGELPGETPEQRVLVVWQSSPSRAETCPEGAVQNQVSSYLELWQQAWGTGVGWYTYNSVGLLPSQIRHFKALLGQAASRPDPYELPDPTPPLRLMRAESA